MAFKMRSHIFGGKEMCMEHKILKDYVRNQNYTMLSFVRDLLAGFIFLFDEYLFRFDPMDGRGSLW